MDKHLEYLQQHGIRGLIFDLDDTLIPEFTKYFSAATLDYLEFLSNEGISLGILTNNFSHTYVEEVIAQLRTRTIEIIVISDAFKPLPFSFWRMLEYFNLKPQQVAFIGDGVLTDRLGPWLYGLTVLPSRMIKKPFYKSTFFHGLRELVVFVADIFRYLFFKRHPRTYFVRKKVDTPVPARHLLFIINPHSSQTDFLQLKQWIKEMAETHSFSYQLYLTKAIKYLKADMGEALGRGEFDLVIAAGGDGTVRETIGLLATFNRHITLGILPTGTGNLLAKSLAIPEDPYSALELLCNNTSPRKPLSIMSVNNAYGAIIAGLGADAEVMEVSCRFYKKILGPLAYIVAGIKVFLFKEKALFMFSIDGKKQGAWAKNVFIIQRNEFARAFFPTLINQNEDEDKLDVCIIKSELLQDKLTSLKLLFEANYDPTQLPYTFQHYKANHVWVKAYPPQKAQVDGDLIREDYLNVKVLPDHLNVIVPTA